MVKNRIDSNNFNLRQPKPTNILDRIKPSVVVLIDQNKNVSGAGFYVSENLIVSNYHITEDSEEILLEVNGKLVSGEVIEFDKGRDLSLIRVNEKGNAAILSSGGLIEVGSDAFVVGHPEGLRYSINKGIVSAVREDLDGFEDIMMVQTGAPLSPGNSGGPLIQENKVIGMISYKSNKRNSEGLGFALHIDEIKDFMSNSNIR